MPDAEPMPCEAEPTAQTDRAIVAETAPSEKACDEIRLEEEAATQPFNGGEMWFFADCVEFCGVDICSGPRSQTKRRLLELLRLRSRDGSFVAYSGKRLVKELESASGAGTVSGVIRDLRKTIEDVLRLRGSATFEGKSIILSGGPGYRFSNTVTVHDHDRPTAAGILALDKTDGGPNDPDGPSGPNGPSDDGGHGPNGEGDDGPNDHDGVKARRAWILQRLGEGQKLQAPAVAKHFKCSATTAKRDLRR